LFSNPPLPLKELSSLEGGLAQVSAIAGSLRQIARAVGEEGLDPELASQLAAVLSAVECLWQQMRELVRANVLSWEGAGGETS
jgi:DNA-binding FrmR family transcriptional regulator